MKYKIGNKVKIRTDLEPNKKYGVQVFVQQMEGDKGKIRTIYDVHSYGYRLEGSTWNWSDEMFETGFNKEISF